MDRVLRISRRRRQITNAHIPFSQKEKKNGKSAKMFLRESAASLSLLGLGGVIWVLCEIDGSVERRPKNTPEKKKHCAQFSLFSLSLPSPFSLEGCFFHYSPILACLHCTKFVGIRLGVDGEEGN